MLGQTACSCKASGVSEPPATASQAMNLCFFFFFIGPNRHGELKRFMIGGGPGGKNKWSRILEFPFTGDTGMGFTRPRAGRTRSSREFFLSYYKARMVSGKWVLRFQPTRSFFQSTTEVGCWLPQTRRKEQRLFQPCRASARIQN